MGLVNRIVRHSFAVAIAVMTAGPVAAEGAAPPFRAGPFSPPPLVAMFDAKNPPSAAANDSPSIDLAWELLDEDQRFLASSLDGWARAPAEGANAGERRRQRADLRAPRHTLRRGRVAALERSLEARRLRPRTADRPARLSRRT